MKKILIIFGLLLFLPFNVHSVNATQPSIIEYGLRVGFDDCDNTEGYLVDLLFSKSNTDSSLYSNTLNPYYFSYDATIRDLALEDTSQIEYLNFDQEWISYLAYFQNAKSETYIDDCTFLFGEDETFKENLIEFKVVILDEVGTVIATSDIYTSDIVPDHETTIFGEMVVFHQTDKTFSLVTYEPVYDVHNYGQGLFLFGFVLLLLESVARFMYFIFAVLALLVAVLEVIGLVKKVRAKSELQILHILVPMLFLISVIIYVVVGGSLDHSTLALRLILGIQALKLILIYYKDKSLFLTASKSTIVVLVLLYLSHFIYTTFI